MRVAAVDIGTNTVRLLVADLAAGRVTDVERRVEIVGLGRGVDATGVLGEEAMERTVGVLGWFDQAIRGHGVRRVRAVATSASRDALNSEDFFDRVEAVLGVRPDLLSGTEEADLTFRGAIAGSGGGGSSLVIDPGGGSTEFVYGSDRPTAISSVDIGSVRLTERMLPERPASTERVEAAVAAVRELFASVDLPEVPDRVVGVAGTFTSLAAITLGLPEHDRALVHGTSLSLHALDLHVARLATMTVEETAAIPPLDPGRAPVILAGAIVAREAVRRSGREAVIVSESDLLDGVALGLE